MPQTPPPSVPGVETPDSRAAIRVHWATKFGFILAATGSAVGLGNIWRFPYQTGEHGGGLFVLTYLFFVAIIGLPVFMAEVFMGRTTQNSPVGAFRGLSRPKSPWLSFGWMGVAAAFIILSYYSVIAGWCLHYTWVAATETFRGKDAAQIEGIFLGVVQSPGLSTFWHLVFMGLSVGIVIAGVRRGIEFWVKILMPVLLVLLVLLLLYGIFEADFVGGVEYIFKPDWQSYSREGVLAALGMSLFSLSVGMGALITYGSYLQRNDDLVGTSLAVGFADVGVALLAALVIFPILFGAGLDPAGGPGLVFLTLPHAFATMPGGVLLAPAFFLLLSFAALTSAISLLEVATAYFIDERGWGRRKAALTTGGLIALFGIPSALHGGTRFFGEGMEKAIGRNWLDLWDFIASNVILPLGALGIALIVAWRVSDKVREEGFKTGSKFGQMYLGWVLFLRYLVPVAVVLVFLNMIGVLGLVLGGGEAADVEGEAAAAAVHPEEEVFDQPGRDPE